MGDVFEFKFMRTTWFQHAMALAKVAMQRSEDPHQKVGACVLNHNHEVLAVAYNGLASGISATQDFWKDRDGRRSFIIHAEINCLSRIKKGEGHVIACTLLPCQSCAINIVAHGIKNVVYGDVYHRDTKAFDIFKFYGIECQQID